MITPTDFRPGQMWLDTDGLPIQAHGGSILHHQGVYYWLARVEAVGITCYSSEDLLNWRNEGIVLRARHPPDLIPSNVVERPKVLFHAASAKFVMWAHVDSGDYSMARVGVAVATSPLGPFSYLGSFRPNGEESRDFTLFQDDDGSAYVVYSSEDNKVMHIGRLSDDYLRTLGPFSRAMINMSREAPAVFKHQGWYFMLTSGCTGWRPNAAEVFAAQSMMGPWRSMGNPCHGGPLMLRQRTFDSQPTWVLPAPDRSGRFIMLADRWNEADLSASRYVWLPLWVSAVKPGENPWAQEAAQDAITPDGRRSPTVAATDVPLDVAVRWLDVWTFANLDYPPHDARNRAAASAGLTGGFKGAQDMPWSMPYADTYDDMVLASQHLRGLPAMQHDALLTVERHLFPPSNITSYPYDD